MMKDRWREEAYTKEENDLLLRVRQKFEGSLKEGKWKQLKVRGTAIFERGRKFCFILYSD